MPDIKAYFEKSICISTADMHQVRLIKDSIINPNGSSSSPDSLSQSMIVCDNLQYSVTVQDGL